MLAMSAASAATSPAGTDEAPRDPLLDALLTRAMTASPLVNARRGEVSAARHEVKAARWQYTPTLSSSVQKGSGSADLYGSSVRADQPLYAGGRLDAELDGAESRRRSAALGVQETGLAIALQVVSAYQSLQTAQAQVNSLASYRERLAALNDTLTRRIDSGVSPAGEMALMNARLAQARNDLAAARSSQANAATTLRRLVGDELPLQAQAPSAPAVVPATPPLCADTASADQQLQATLDAQPGVRRAIEDVDAARHAARGQRAALRPAVTLRVEQPVGHVPDGVSRAARVSVQLSFTPNAGLSSLSHADAAEERVAVLTSQADALRREAAQQIRTECAEQAAVGERAVGLAQARGYTTDVLASTTRLFLAGKRGWLDVLNAAREDFDNEQALHAAVAALRGSQARLRLLSGAVDLGLALPDDASFSTPSAPGTPS